MSKNPTVAVGFVFASGRTSKRCISCPTTFLAASPRHDKCKRCHLAAQKAANEAAIRKVEVMKALADKKALEQATLETLKHAFLTNELPKSAKVTRSGRQVVICWMGRSTTFYV